MGLLNKSLYKKKHNKQYLRIVIAWVALVGTVPLWALDTDNDTLPDIFESNNGRDPLVPDYLVSAGWNTTCGKDDSTTNGQGVQCWGANSTNLNNNMPTFTKLTQITNGSAHACAIDDGAAVCWGSNFDGRATPPAMTNVTHISAFKNHSCAAHDAGVSCWGKDSNGQTVAPALNNPLMVAAGDTHSCALDENGGVNSVVCWGNDSSGQSTPPALSNPVYLSAGVNTNCAIDDSGVVCWGSNNFGVATPAALTNPVSVALGNAHACAIDDTGVVCWGADGQGQASPPVTTNPVDINMGYQHGCALSEEGVQCWGNNGNGQSDTAALSFDSDSDGVQNLVDACPFDDAGSITDTDSDGLCDEGADTDDDNDGVPDVSDLFPLDPTESTDADSDGVGDNGDNCPNDANPGQENADGDAEGNVCDSDDDNDGVPDISDAFPLDPTESTDADSDGVGDNGDNCPNDSNPGQEDSDTDGVGDVCDDDADNDGLSDINDNCPLIANAGQENNDGDAEGDVCDDDDDNDGSFDVEEVFVGTDPFNQGERPYWWRTYYGDNDGDQLGYEVSGIGDINGDGYDDVAIGVPYSDVNGSNSGTVKIISGKSGNIIDLLHGDYSGDRFGFGLAAVGDSNKDGYDDFAIGAYSADGVNGSDSGEVKIISGIDRSVLYLFGGDGLGYRFGSSVADARDINSDGYNDILVGAVGANVNGNYSGQAKIYSGIDGSVLHDIAGSNAEDRFGVSVSYSGDFNNDGVSDFAIGAYLNDDSADNAGSVTVYSGADGAAIFNYYGQQAGDGFGVSVGNAKDVNSDGYEDLIVGAWYEDGVGVDSGAARIYSGIDGSLIRLIKGDSIGENFGVSVDGLGDINGDGYGEFIIGAHSDDGNGVVVNGNRNGSVTVFDGFDGEKLYTFYGEWGAYLGESIDNLGDLNGDGLDDFVVGARNDYTNGSTAGQARIYLTSDLLNDPDMDFLVNSYDPDDDNDGMPDVWEDTYGLNSLDESDAEIDLDNDGAINLLEYQNGFDPTVVDNDNDIDLINDLVDNCPLTANNNQLDTDADGQGDACDADDDNDGMPDSYENTYGLDPLQDDTAFDLDNDGWTNLTEYQQVSNPAVFNDADGDESSDFEEALAGTNATDPNERPAWWRTVSLSSAGDRFGETVTGGGDVNGDGYDDYAVTSYQIGKTQVFSGLDNSRLYVFDGGGQFGKSIDIRGDINNDGYSDVVIGTKLDNTNGNNAGKVDVYSGIDGSNIFSFYGDAASEYFGWSARYAGDVNNDGYIDVIAGTIGDYVKVYSGLDGSLIYTEYPASGVSSFGQVVEAAGDLNGDGYADYMVGNPDSDINGYGAGTTYFYSGRDGLELFSLHGSEADDFGYDVSSVGDINGDGYDDAIIGANEEDDGVLNDVGSVSLISGLDGGLINKFKGAKQLDSFGHSIDGFGDINADGYQDLLVGVDSSNEYVTVISGVNGITLYKINGDAGVDDFGESVSFVGDIDGDGYADLAIGAPMSDLSGNRSGSVRLYKAKDLMNDNDLDKIINSADPDDDNDGMPDDWENQYGLNPVYDDTDLDLDGDGATNIAEYKNNFDPSMVDNDSDGDGVNELVDNCILASNSSQVDSDGDGYGDACDVFPFNALESFDSDNDGIGNNADGDDDNDSVLDVTDSYPLDPNKHSGNHGLLYKLLGDDLDDDFGSSLASLGDINGNGYDDFAIGAPNDDNNGVNSGSIKVLDGADGQELYTVDGALAYAGLSTRMAFAGDVNGDGYGDLIVGEYNDDTNGTNTGLVEILSGLDGGSLYSFYGANDSDKLGYSVGSAGDVNLDGYDDVIAGAVGVDFSGNDVGAAFVYSGYDGTILYSLYGDESGGWFGLGVSGQGDINNDGYPDLVVGAPNGEKGYVRVFSGVDGSQMYTFFGQNISDRLGYAVSSDGDINADGYMDIVASAPYSDTYGSNSGSVIVYSGIDGRILSQFYGDSANDWFGLSLATVGDLDQDGFGDFIIGARNDDNNGDWSGSARVISGKEGSTLYVYNGLAYREYFGLSVSPAGDANNDGYIDLLIGSGNGVHDRRGAAYIYSGISAFIDTDNDGFSDAEDAFSDNDAAALDPDYDLYPDSWNSSCDSSCQLGSGLVLDNCPYLSNPSQLDTDSDGLGDECDADIDSDGVLDDVDNCIQDYNPQQIDTDGDSTGDACDIDDDGDLSYDEEELLASTDPLNAAQRPYWTRTYIGDSDGDNFGASLAYTGNDNYRGFVVGAPNAGGDNSGQVERMNTWDFSASFTLDGNAPGDNLGFDISGVGDVNDVWSYADIIVGVPGADMNGAESGSVIVFSNEDGNEVYTLNGDAPGDNFGFSVGPVGDINNWSYFEGRDINADYYADFVVGAPGSDTNGDNSGSAYVISGVDGSSIFVFNGDDSGDQFGWDVNSAGDMNMDYYSDIIIGVPGDDNNGDGSGSARVFSGADGSVLYTFDGDATGDQFGTAVASAGDVNGDYYGTEVIVGAPGADVNGIDSGAVKIFKGINGGLLFNLNGDDAGDNFGAAVSKLGDVNSDGYADFIVGAPGDDNNGVDSGSVQIFSGIDASILFTINGSAPGDGFGGAIAYLGGIGLGDDPGFIVGAAEASIGAVQNGMARLFKYSDLLNDLDFDTWVNAADAFPNDPAEWWDTDGDGIGNNADPDDDDDNMPDSWENIYGLNPLLDESLGDLDGDGFTNIEEYNNGTDPTVYDVAISVKDDYNNDGLAGWIWHGTGGSVDNLNRTWTPNWAASSPGWVPPSRTYPPPSDAIDGYDIVTTGDFNGDGDADWLWRETAGAGWKIWQMEGGYRSGQNTPADFDAAHDWAVAGAGDTDRDGDDDVILFNSTTGEINIWEMQTTHIATHNVGTRSGFDVVRVGDFDNDADTDLMLRKQNEDVLRFWEIEDNAFVQEYSTSQTGAGYVSQCAGDFNNDGHADVYFLAPDGTSKWYEYSNFVRQQQIYGANQSAWTLLGCGDYDGDGDTDMLWTTADGEGRNKIFINESFNNSATFYTNRYGGTNPANPGYGYEKRGNGN